MQLCSGLYPWWDCVAGVHYRSGAHDGHDDEAADVDDQNYLLRLSSKRDNLHLSPSVSCFMSHSPSSLSSLSLCAQSLYLPVSLSLFLSAVLAILLGFQGLKIILAQECCCWKHTFPSKLKPVMAVCAELPSATRASGQHWQLVQNAHL